MSSTYVELLIPGDQVQPGDLVEDGHTWRYIFNISRVVGFRNNQQPTFTPLPVWWYVGHVGSGSDRLTLRPSVAYRVLRPAGEAELAQVNPS